MSEQTPATNETESLVLGADPSTQMGAILDFLAPETGAASAAEDAAATDPAPASAGQPEPAAEDAGAAGTPPGEPAAGAGGEPGVPGAGAADGAAGATEPGAGGAEPPAGTVDATTLTEKWGEVSTAFETKQAEHLRQGALAEVRTEHAKYFEHVEMHPRLLVGKEVPSLTNPGQTERLKDAADAKDWQDAVKHLLAKEVTDRAGAKAEEYREVFTTVHSSIDLFRNNVDLIPGTKQFDKELADRFATLAKEYELRSDGKLVGYSVPVQPLINQVRQQLAATRAAPKAPAAPAPSAKQQQAAEQPRTPTGQWDGPQAGLSSKAGQSSGEDNVAQGIMDAFYRQNGVIL